MDEKSQSFIGIVVQRGRQPGIFVPPEMFEVFKPKTKTRDATLTKVSRTEAPIDYYFYKRVAKVNSKQRIIHIPKQQQTSFIPGMECLVEVDES